jgi:hypothetical protein
MRAIHPTAKAGQVWYGLSGADPVKLSRKGENHVGGGIWS